MGCVCGKTPVTINDRRFEILDTLGEGGFSYVYLVQELEGSWISSQRGPKWALKKIDCHSREDESKALEEVKVHKLVAGCRFVLPCEAHCVLKSAQACSVYLLLPFYKKGTLLDELSIRSVRKDYIPEPRVLRLFHNICSATQAFHSVQPQAFAHRDLKPGNALLSDSDEAVLMDLGSARVARLDISSSKEAQIIQDYAAENCSMAYRAPELFHISVGDYITEKTDIWSLGCLLYALCFFKSPFDLVHERGDSVALAVQSGKVDIPEPSPYSDFVHDLILSAMQLDGDFRPDISSLLSRLKEYAHSVSISLTPAETRRPKPDV